MDEVKSLTDAEAMDLALQAGTKGLGHVHPNPPVGCVILSSKNELLAVGHHHVYGGDHAEIDALKHIQNTEALRGARIFVTLEPCAHQGKTGSCAKRLAALPVGEVIYGLQDPNPLVAGQGARILRASGIAAREWDTDDKIMRAKFEKLPEIFLHIMRTQMPFVALKLATTQDGAIAGAGAEDRWITGPESLRHVHFLRAQYDAVLVGVNTFLADDPALNVRHPDYKDKAPNKAIVLDPAGRGLERLREKTAALRNVRPLGNIFWVTGREVAADALPKGVTRIAMALTEGCFELKDLLQYFYELGIQSVFVEGGGETAAQFLRQKQVQRLYHFQSPKVMGAGGRFLPEGLRNIQNLQIVADTRATFGEDTFVSGRIS